MNPTVAINVTKSHFDASVRAFNKGNIMVSERCLVAQAIRNLYPKRKVSVGTWNVTVGSGRSRKHFELSAKARKLVLAFDGLQIFEPTKAEQKKNTKLRARLPLTVEMIQS